MKWMSLAVIFGGTLIVRGGGTGAKRIMDENPERAAFIADITGWDRVEHGTLTLDNTDPLPGSALAPMEAAVVCDPATDGWIDQGGEIVQSLVAAKVKRPPPDRSGRTCNAIFSFT